MTVQLRLSDSVDEWHTMSRWDADTLIDRLEDAISQLRKAENKRRMTPAKRARYRELLKAHTQAPLDETDLGELRELDRAIRGAGVDTLVELAAAFEPENDEENHNDD